MKETTRSATRIHHLLNQPEKGITFMNTKRTLLALIIMAMMATLVTAQTADQRAAWAAAMARRGYTANARTDESQARANSQPGAGDIAQQEKKSNDLTGSWLITVTRTDENAPPPFKALVTFTEDGGLVIAVQGDVTTDPPFVNSPGHGAWVKTGKRTFVMTFLQLSYTLDGRLLGIVKVRQTMNLNETGTEWSGPSIIEVTDSDGNPVFSGGGPAHATRILVEP